MRYRLALLLALLPGPVAAQRLVPAARGTASITAADVQRRIGIIADDSMLGRATPSPQLDAVAAYVAGEFQRFGLKPGGDSGTYFQHYPLEVSRFDPESSTVRITSRTPGSWRAGQDVLLVEGQPPAGAPAASAVVITGSADAAGALDSAAVTGKVVFLAYGPGLNAIAPKVLPLRPLALMLVAAFPDSIWAKLPGHAASVSVRNPSSESGPAIPAVFVVRTATAGALLTQGGATADSLRAWGLWGSAYFADHPTVPLADVIADLNIDMVGRNSKDTVAVIGREHSNLGVMLDSVATAHRELNIKPVGDLWPQEGLFFRSDHYNFAKKGVPILFFTTGLHPDYHQVTDSPEKINAEKETRFARLVFYLGQAVANTSQRPRWNPDSYKRIVI